MKRPLGVIYEYLCQKNGAYFMIEMLLTIAATTMSTAARISIVAIIDKLFF